MRTSCNAAAIQTGYKYKLLIMTRDISGIIHHEIILIIYVCGSMDDKEGVCH